MRREFRSADQSNPNNEAGWPSQFIERKSKEKNALPPVFPLLASSLHSRRNV